MSPNGNFLFVANFESSSATSVFSINATTGALTQVAGSPFLAAAGNAVTVSPNGQFLYVFGGDMSAFSINATTGALTNVPGSPYTLPSQGNSVTVDPTGKFLYASIAPFNSTTAIPDIITYSINATGSLTQLSQQGVDANGGESMAITTGTKAVVFTPKFAYATNETDKTISEWTITDSTGALTAVAGSPL